MNHNFSKRKENRIIKLIVFFFIFTFLICVRNYSYSAISIEKKEATYNSVTLKITSDKEINIAKIYKKNKSGKYILIFKKKGNGKKEIESKIARYHLSDKEETELIIVLEDKEKSAETGKVTIEKVQEVKPMNPEETAKPSWTQPVIPTKTTPSIHPSEAPGPSGTGDITGIKLNKNSVTLKIGQTDKLTYTVTPEGAHPHLVWRTDANEICSIEADGTIKGVSLGQAQISIKADNGVMDICDVTVVEETTPSTSPATPNNNNNNGNEESQTSSGNDIILSETSLRINKGETKKLTVTIPNETQRIKIIWSTSNKEVCTVAEDGTITGINDGTATVTVRTEDGKTASCKVTVGEELPFEEDYIEHLRNKLIYYGSKTNYGCVIDADLCRLVIFKKNENNEWEFEKGWNAILGVTGPGHGGPAEMNNWQGPRSKTIKGAWRVVGKKKHGTIDGKQNYITCFVPYNHFTANHHCQGIHGYQKDADKLEVKDRFLVEGCTCISIDRAIWVYNNVPDDSTVIVFDKYNPMPKWDEWDMAPSLNSAKSVDVPNSISINKSSLNLRVGESEGLTLTTNPEKATYKTVTWKSFNNDIATVDENGKVTAISQGTATIVVKVLGLTASCKVTVE